MSFHVVIVHISFLSAPRVVRLTSKLNNTAAMEGKDAIFKCTVTPADARVKWFHNNVPIAHGAKYKIEHGGNTHSVTVTCVTLKDAGKISVDAEGKSCEAKLQVQGRRSAFTVEPSKLNTVQWHPCCPNFS